MPLSVTWSVIILLVVNLGLIWLLLAAPLGLRTIRLRRHLGAAPGTVWRAVCPLGERADWHHAVLSSRPLGGNRVEQSFTHFDRTGEPIRRTLLIHGHSEEPPAHFSYEAQIVEDSALDASFWKDYRERRSLRSDGSGTLMTVETTDRYRGAAFLIFRYFMMRREIRALEGWLETGQSLRNGIFEYPSVQAGLAILSTLILWPFFGLSPQGLVLSAMLTVVIVLHELGHLVAYRAFGHQKVRMLFIPLLGGVAIGGRPYNSLFEVAVCALMGAGMSAFFVPAGISLYDLSGKAGQPALLVFLLILGAFNLLNLLPMNRFDGGQVLRQVFVTRFERMAGSFAVTLAILWVGWRIGLPSMALIAGLSVFTLLSVLASGGKVKPRHKLDAMTGTQRLAAGMGLYAAILLHGYAIIFAADRLFS